MPKTTEEKPQIKIKSMISHSNLDRNERESAFNMKHFDEISDANLEDEPAPMQKPGGFADDYHSFDSINSSELTPKSRIEKSQTKNRLLEIKKADVLNAVKKPTVRGETPKVLHSSKNFKKSGMLESMQSVGDNQNQLNNNKEHTFTEISNMQSMDVESTNIKNINDISFNEQNIVNKNQTINNQTANNLNLDSIPNSESESKDENWSEK